MIRVGGVVERRFVVVRIGFVGCVGYGMVNMFAAVVESVVAVESWGRYH